MKHIAAVLLVVAILLSLAPIPVSQAQEVPQEANQPFCSICMFVPFLPNIPNVIRGELAIKEPLGVSQGAQPTYSIPGIVVDHETHSSRHLRIWFFPDDLHITNAECNVPIAGNDPSLYPDIANVRFQYGPEPELFTYLRNWEAEEPAPVVGWRLQEFSDPTIFTLWTRYVVYGPAEIADQLERLLTEPDHTVYIAQINRRDIAAFDIHPQLDEGGRFTLECYGPN